MRTALYLFFLALGVGIFGPRLQAFGQIVGVQLENAPSVLQGQAGLPTKFSPVSNVWGGFATTDSLQTIQVGASYGLGIANGGGFDLGGLVRFHKISVSAWTSGITVRQDQPPPTTSTLQRLSRFGVLYQDFDRRFSVGVGAQVQYVSFNASNRIEGVSAYVSGEYKAHPLIRVGLRLSNPFMSKAQSEGIIGLLADSTLLSRDVKGKLKAPTQFLLYGNGAYKYQILGVEYGLGIGYNQNTANPYLTSGSGQSGLSIQSKLQVGIKEKVFLNIGKRFTSMAATQQLSYGVSLKTKPVTLTYSSVNLFYQEKYRVHTLGLVINVR